MADYSMTRNGTFGGSNNFFAHLAGIGQSTMHGMNEGMNFMNNLMSFQNRIATNPSAVDAAIADNINKAGASTLDHYERYPHIQRASYIAGGGDPTHPDSPFFSLFANAQGNPNVSTPAYQTPANTQAPLQQVNLSGTTMRLPSVVYNPELER